MRISAPGEVDKCHDDVRRRPLRGPEGAGVTPEFGTMSWVRVHGV